MPVSLDPIWFGCCRRHGRKRPLPEEGWAVSPSLQWFQPLCAWVPRAACPGALLGSPAPASGGRSASRPARPTCGSRRGGRAAAVFTGGGGARRRGGRPAGGQGGLAGAGCRRALPSGRKAPRPGSAERGSASPGRFRARDRGHEESQKNPSGRRAPAGGSPPGWPGGAVPAEIAQREGSGCPSGPGSRVRGGRVGKGPPRGLGRVHPVACRPATFAYGSLSKSSPRAPRTAMEAPAHRNAGHAPSEGEAEGEAGSSCPRRSDLRPSLPACSGRLAVSAPFLPQVCAQPSLALPRAPSPFPIANELLELNW